MATTFQIVVAGYEREYARQAAAAAFRELDRLESELSRYVESSDIARANRMAVGETITIGDDALQCLLLAASLASATGQAFDAAYASLREGPEQAGSLAFTVDPATHTLTSHVVRLHLDMGAIGKGYALDRLAETLRDWNVTSACLQSGGSTALALDAPPDTAGWTVGIGEDDSYRTLPLRHAALSGSGIEVKGDHLIDPSTGAPSRRGQRTWALAPTAAVSDALSTAFFVFDDQEIAAFCAAHPEIGGAYINAEQKLIAHGTLK